MPRPPPPKDPQPASRPADDERVSELVGLLSAQQPEPEEPVYSRATFPRASVPRAGAVARATDTRLDDEEPEQPVRGGGQRVIPAAPAAPSPFTAALARMVAGDQDVRQAVEDALGEPAQTRPDDDAEPWPVRPEPVRPAETAVPSPPAHQEEETVGDQVVAPPSTSDRPVEVPTWAVPEVAPASVSPREEAIADLLRGALAQGHSDEALAGILRRVLAGDSPQAALPEPAAAPEPVFAAPTMPVPSFEAPLAAEPEPVAEAPVDAAPDAPVLETPVLVAPAVELPVVPEPAVVEAVVPEQAVEPPAAEVAPAPAPVTLFGATGSMWGTPSTSASLWGEPVAPVSTRPADTDAPIWAEVARQESSPAPLFDETPEAEPVAVDEPALDDVAADDVEADLVAEPAAEPEQELAAAVEETAEDIAVEVAEEPELAGFAPLLARTASDPAPMMSLDATTVMPPLSLLPPLPSSRGRGRPPVPPATRRPSASAPAPTGPAPSVPEAVVPEPAPAAAVVEPEPTPVPAPATRSLATVTRLPVAPLMAGPDIPELFEDLEAPGSAPEPAAPAVVVSSGDVAGRLELLGLPGELLGDTFTQDVAERGTYAALTRALALQLPKAPELPLGAGDAVFVVGPGADALRAARTLAATLHLDPDCVQWATRGDLAGLAPRDSRITSVDAAIDRRQEALASGTVTMVAVDAPLRSDAYWMAQLVSVWAPAAVWAVVEATRKPEDLEPWIDGLPRVDALIVQDADLSADPAAVLRRVDAPVAFLDGVRATPHRWASLLCERLESTTT
ncbi:UNVERIFIED_ORG: hypothetical protein E4P37_17185 [Bacillus sp. AZ43]